MAGTPFKDGPAYLTDASDNVYVPAANTYALVRHIHLCNTDSSARTVTLWVGATGAEAGGTEILKDHSIGAKGEYDLYFPSGLKLLETDFLVGAASTTNVVTATVTGELHAV